MFKKILIPTDGSPLSAQAANAGICFARSVGAEVVKLGGASLVFRQTVERAGALLVEAEVKVALVDRSRMKPARIPGELQQALE